MAATKLVHHTSGPDSNSALAAARHDETCSRSYCFAPFRRQEPQGLVLVGHALRLMKYFVVSPGLQHRAGRGPLNFVSYAAQEQEFLRHRNLLLRETKDPRT
ncbi:MAG: hypothetical protein HY675_08245 [Chloroflexi bacterium]|nr:hypothetical protein [Chloroflexota bacterium]